MEVYLLLIFFSFLIAIVLFLKVYKKPNAEINLYKNENNQLKERLVRLDERLIGITEDRENIHRNLQQERARFESIIEKINRELMDEKTSRTKTDEVYKAQQQRLLQQEQYIIALQQQFKIEFENIANKLLEEKSEKFSHQNRLQLDVILSPFKDKLKDFEDKVDKVYKLESDERNILKGVISQLMDLNRQISDEAQNLSKALKGDNKKQGNWGEVILERILERSGLINDQEYRIQTSFTSQDGSRLQPDVIIHLPDDKHLVVDAKVSLVAYERLVNSVLDEERELYGKQHIQSIKNHVNELSVKNYHELHQINSPDFVLLFIPIESSFSIAVQIDADLFNYAWERRVVIVSPSTLLATLRTIASVWKQERQNRNVMEIARLSGDMYDKFVGFINDLESIGKNIQQSQVAYDKAINKLSTGRGNLTNTAEKIKKLGARTNKIIDQKYLSDHTE
jgi:DNA recombination protein RmuC